MATVGVGLACTTVELFLEGDDCGEDGEGGEDDNSEGGEESEKPTRNAEIAFPERCGSFFSDHVIFLDECIVRANIFYQMISEDTARILGKRSMDLSDKWLDSKTKV